MTLADMIREADDRRYDQRDQARRLMRAMQAAKDAQAARDRRGSTIAEIVRTLPR